MKTAYQRGIFNGNILVAQHGKVVYQQSFGYADGSKTKPLSGNMKFDIGSISKEFNGVAIMMLAEQGRLSPDDSVQKFFPEFSSWAGSVKIKHLLNYTSGIPIMGFSDSVIYQNLLALKDLTAPPGTVYIYNSANVFLQRRIIEKISGEDYNTFISRYLLLPAGMTESLVDYPVDANGIARAFDNEGHNVPYDQQMKGWVRLPVQDLYKWTLALHNYRLINRTSLEELGNNFPGGESSLGTAVFKNHSLVWHQHQGSNSNYEAAFYCNIPEEITIVMMTNNQQMKVWPLKTAILNILHHQPYSSPKKSLYLSIRDTVLQNAEEGIAYYKSLKENNQQQYDFSFEIGDLISTGKYIQRRGKFDDAIKLFSLAVKLPAQPQDISYGYELTGDCYKSKGDKEKAIAFYNKALSVFPANKNAAGMLRELQQ